MDLLSRYQMSPKIMYLNSIDTNMFSFGEETEEWDFVAAYQAGYNMKKPVRYLMDLMKGLYDI